MARHHVSAGRPGSIALLEDYLGELSGRLRGPRGARIRVLSEVHDGLAETIDAHVASGTAPDVAAGAAIAEFGDPETVASSFAAELATASARRTIAAFIATGPLVGIWWLLLLHPTPWRGGIVAALVAIPALPLVALAIAAAVGTYATTGRLMRWLPEASASRALTAATAVAVLCIAADLIVLGVLAVHLATGSRHSVPLVAVAATASIVRIAAAIAVLRSMRTMRAGLRDA
jgi:hypothetical protein